MCVRECVRRMGRGNAARQKRCPTYTNCPHPFRMYVPQEQPSGVSIEFVQAYPCYLKQLAYDRPYCVFEYIPVGFSNLYPRLITTFAYEYRVDSSHDAAAGLKMANLKRAREQDRDGTNGRTHSWVVMR